MRMLSALTVTATLLLSTPITAQEPVDLEMVSAIRAEAFERSEVMDTLWWLTDRYGPRLTNSPQQRRRRRVGARRGWRSTGMAERSALEPWGEFGLGWSFERCVVEMTAPDTTCRSSPSPRRGRSGLDEPVSGVPVLRRTSKVVRGTGGPTAARSRGRIVLNGSLANAVETPFELLATRHDEESLAELVAAPEPGGESAWASRGRRVRVKRRDAARSARLKTMPSPRGGCRRSSSSRMAGAATTTA